MQHRPPQATTLAWAFKQLRQLPVQQPPGPFTTRLTTPRASTICPLLPQGLQDSLNTANSLHSLLSLPLSISMDTISTNNRPVISDLNSSVPVRVMEVSRIQLLRCRLQQLPLLPRPLQQRLRPQPCKSNKFCNITIT